jgi:glucosamine--fructose-6-phosphate aminotransferase (isomerizing)
LTDALAQAGLTEQFKQRSDQPVLLNGTISVHKLTGQSEENLAGVTVTYKVAAEIGRLGDNVAQLREQIGTDAVLHALARLPHSFQTISAHTRWASVGAITVANCHPMDNMTGAQATGQKGIVHACLNGDIDNYLLLRQQWEAQGESIPLEITTDTKIIPLQVEMYLRKGHDVEEAFRLAVNDFEGSHAITMHTDLAPGKFFLAQRGSGQAVFVGLAADHYMPTSEVYGFVEETSDFVKLNGEKIVESPNGPVQGQIFILDQQSKGRLEGIKAMFYDGSPIELSEQNIQHTQITSRDIDRQDFPHYFLKEITEAPQSVTRTLQNRWKVKPDAPDRLSIALEPAAFPDSIAKALINDEIRRIYFIGQGTAGVAAQAIADILNFYLDDATIKISALKASELSGFQIGEHGNPKSMADALVIAISQSGTTTDTNRAVDMVRARGAYTMAIVNRRDSDITFKVHAVAYTSSGRDIEMSVASTKAFYSQIVAGALVSLKMAEIKSCRSQSFITEELKALLALPDQMRKVLSLGEQIQASAQRHAPAKTYWAAVGSGPNKAAADEIRIKLSELCYKTISSDYVEDKKHIDLSSEPLIIVCAAGAPASVIGDITKDTAIFKAHKATPIVIADEGETRFSPYSDDVIHVPVVQAHLAPILNTLAGHLWGYHAALAINNGSLFLHNFREDIHKTIDQSARKGLDVYELILEKSFREKIAHFYAEFRRRQATGQLPTTISHSADLLLLFKYLSGRLPVSDFELDFGRKGTALNMLNCLFEFMGHSINGMSRPVDAIKHQAKTVTVGTSRISERIEGILFEALEQHEISISQLINRNIIVLKNLQAVVAGINGSILYRIDGLNLLGEPTDRTTIEILRKEGVLKELTSRVETDKALKGTKRIIVRQGNVYIGKGRKDDRSILVIPAISTDASAPNRIEFLLLLNIRFHEDVPLPDKVKALGGKYEHIKNIVQENSLAWEDKLLQLVPMEDLFGHSAEKIGESIVRRITGTGSLQNESCG